MLDLRERGDGLLWVDIPEWGDEAEQLLSKVFQFHPLAIADCATRNPVPKVHVYPGPRVRRPAHPRRPAARRSRPLPRAGPVHRRPGYVVTVHGPLNPAVDPEPRRCSRSRACWPAASSRAASHPASADDLSYALVVGRDPAAARSSSPTSPQRRVAARTPAVVTGRRDTSGDPEQFLDADVPYAATASHRGQHAWRRSAARCSHACADHRGRTGPSRQRLFDDVVDQFDHLRSDGRRRRRRTCRARSSSTRRARTRRSPSRPNASPSSRPSRCRSRRSRRSSA